MTDWYSLLSGAALKSILLLGAAGLVALLMRRHSAAARHIVWTAAFAALMALPLLTVALPVLQAPQWMPPGVTFQVTAPLRSRLGVDASEPRPSGSGPSQPARPGEAPRNPAILLALLVWLSGAAVSLAQMAQAWLAAIRIRREARPFPAVSIEGVDVLESRPGSMPMAIGLLRP